MKLLTNEKSKPLYNAWICSFSSCLDYVWHILYPNMLLKKETNLLIRRRLSSLVKWGRWSHFCCFSYPSSLDLIHIYPSVLITELKVRYELNLHLYKYIFCWDSKKHGQLWLWSYGSWIYNLCNWCLSLLKLWVWIPLNIMW